METASWVSVNRLYARYAILHTIGGITGKREVRKFAPAAVGIFTTLL